MYVLAVIFSILFSGCYSKSVQKSADGDVLEDIVTKAEIEMYKDGVSGFHEISLDDISTILKSVEDDQPYYFYFGRTTCLYCRKFVIENERDLQNMPNFYYIDTEKLSDTESVSLEEYGITTVPAILKATTSSNLELQDLYEFEELISEEGA